MTAAEGQPGQQQPAPAEPPVALHLDQDQRGAAEEDDVGHPEVGVPAEHAVHCPGDVGAEGGLPGRQRDAGGGAGLEQFDHLRQGDQRPESGRRPAKGFDEHEGVGTSCGATAAGEEHTDNGVRFGQFQRKEPRR